MIHKEGDRLIIEPVKGKSLLRVVAAWQPSDETFPDVDKDLLPLDDVEPWMNPFAYLLDTNLPLSSPGS